MKVKKFIAIQFIILSLFSVILPTVNTVQVFADSSIDHILENTNQNQGEIEKTANILKEMFEKGVTEQNFSSYIYTHFSIKDISDVEQELDTTIQNPYDRVPWNQVGNCIAGKIRNAFFAMINVSALVSFAQRKAWKELAMAVIKFAKANGLKTNIYIIAAQLALWAVQCGSE
ncbi:streptococcin A-M57 [Streptococcus sciuri]|uniref:Streptococcin A-M57 n=1 Tax=Streptococcus sciuri TaxID=2973939 RepID=A0ABT2F9F0_9STRE|nr:streptococcin A-M57 [Streptococcus sciuri]MCS4488442.1 streptococcin A-M57 [Streptococcus sciuri]